MNRNLIDDLFEMHKLEIKARRELRKMQPGEPKPGGVDMEVGKTAVWGDDKIRKCSICDREFQGRGNNAEPVNRGRCCDECDMTTVFGMRVEILNEIRRGFEGSSE